MDFEGKVGMAAAAYEAFQARDWDRLLSLFTADAEFDLSGYEGWPGEPVYRGHEGVRRFYDQWTALFEDYRAEAEQLIDSGEDTVLIIGRERGRATRSSEPLDGPLLQLATGRGGKIARVQVFSDRAHAMRAAGLS